MRPAQGQGIPAVLAPVLVHQDLIRPQGEGLTGGTVVILQGDQVQLHDPAIDSRGALELAGNVQQEGILLLKGGEGGVADSAGDSGRPRPRAVKASWLGRSAAAMLASTSPRQVKLNSRG